MSDAFGRQVVGTKRSGIGRANIHEEGAIVASSRLNRVYEEHEFILPTLTSNVSIRTVIDHATQCSCARATGAFGLIPRAQRVLVRNRGDLTFTMRLHATDEDPLSVEDGENLSWDSTEVEDLFLTNTGGAGILVRIALA